MDAKNYRLQQLFSGTQQFVIPIYQRQYSWEQRDWQALWDDILDVYEEGGEDIHFLGSIVSKPYSAAAGGISSFVVIDGQQRLTTLTLLIAALRDTFAALDDGRVVTADKLHNLYLTNQYGDGNERYKVVPTRSDQEQYFRVIDRKALAATDPNRTDRIGPAYHFFTRQLRSTDSSGAVLDLTKLEKVILGQFEVVSITLGPDDNDYRVFESLNARGRPLSQTDLLRNYFLMRFDGDMQESVYAEYFLPMTTSLQALPPNRSDTMFQYALQRTGIYVRDKDVYFQWKRRCDKLSLPELREEIAGIAFDCENFLRIQIPALEPDERVRFQLDRLVRLGITTPTPYLLNAYRWYRGTGSTASDRDVNAAGLATILSYIESFLIRRLLCGIPTNPLNRIFLRLADQLDPSLDPVTATRVALSQPGLRWPDDVTFADNFATYPLYKDTRPNQRRLILDTLEMSYGHKEALDPSTTTIEHVMPKTLTNEWRDQLGLDADRIHARWLDTVGNLTLSGYNAEMSNKPFAEKRKWLATSKYDLNAMIAEQDHWDDNAIQERAKVLTERAIRIWVGPVQRS
ncbi:MAG TPA: DUF262 domain-containing protein [Thermomicrobiales bacterium]|jgi:hypothetical protein|nr:DUF262 domain-containing protein [Thermomicrobiales bacterium]